MQAVESTSRRILIIDDNPAIHEDYRKVLSIKPADRDYLDAELAFFGENPNKVERLALPEIRLESAHQGQQGLEMVEQAQQGGDPYAMAFVDMRMPPGWDGLRTIEEIWKVAPDLQVVMCTAFSDYSWDDLLERLGHTDKLLILKKPFDNIEVAQLAVALTEKWNLTRQAQLTQAELESLVDRRTEQLRRIEAHAVQQKDILQLATNIACVGHWRLQLGTGELTWSNLTFQMHGVSPDEFSPNIDDVLSMICESDRECFREALGIVSEKPGTTDIKFGVQRPGGDIGHLHLRAVSEAGPDGAPLEVFGVVQDITDHELAMLAVKHASLHDPLTTLPNRVKFNERLGEYLKLTKRDGHETHLMLLDVDRFKEINDTLGHPAGDALLKMVAARMATCIRETDVAARLGGDEFAIILRSGEPRDVATFAERLYETMKAPFEIEGQMIAVRFSAGIANAPADATEPDELLKKADIALYRAKEDGRGVYRYFEPSMDTEAKRQRQISEELMVALREDQFVLHYQPQFAAGTERLCCLEALVRWEHPTQGLIAPADFIPIAEATGLIVPIGRRVLEAACKEAAGWPEHIRVAVNVSAAQFKDEKLLDDVVRSFSEAGLDPHRLELEITETAMLQESEDTLATLHALRDMGIRIVMDDFGVGYSSLSYLRSFPFDKIKLDRSFVDANVATSDSMAIVRAVAGLGRNLGMETTAEGVETEGQLESVVSEGYTQVQGFLYGRPVPGEEVAKLLLAATDRAELEDAST